VTKSVIVTRLIDWLIDWLIEKFGPDISDTPGSKLTRLEAGPSLCFGFCAPAAFFQRRLPSPVQCITMALSRGTTAVAWRRLPASSADEKYAWNYTTFTTKTSQGQGYLYLVFLSHLSTRFLRGGEAPCSEFRGVSARVLDRTNAALMSKCRGQVYCKAGRDCSPACAN
jgi:hypothetical protein